MFNMNNQLRQKAKPTDVISLPLDESTGEIFLCPDYIQASGYPQERITHLFVHSLLHIAGFTHDGDDDFAEMSQYEVKILAELDIENPYAN